MNTATSFAGTAGRIAGTAARHLLWLNAQIDWSEVGAVALHGIVTLVVMTYWAGRYTRHAWDALVDASEQLGKTYAAWLVPAPAEVSAALAATPIPAAAPVRAVALLHPLATLAEDLQQLSCRELRAITGCRSKRSKAQLIALALA
jgi:hypothetical protein